MPVTRYGGTGDPDLVGGEGAITRMMNGQATWSDYLQILMMAMPGAMGAVGRFRSPSGFKLPGPYGRALRAEPESLPGIRQGVTPGGGDDVPAALYEARKQGMRGDTLRPGRVREIGPLVEDLNIQRARFDVLGDPLHPELMDPTPGELLIQKLIQGLRFSSQQ